MTGYLLAAAALLVAFSGPGQAEEPHACVAAVAAMRIRAAALPDNDLSRRFAETDLRAALDELGAGDPEECEELVEHAGHIIATRPYALRPGEALDGYGPDGPLQAPAGTQAAAPR